MKQKNVLGTDLEICNENPMTGFFRDGCCNTNEMDVGSHTVCVIVTKEFLEFSKSKGNDLTTLDQNTIFLVLILVMVGVYALLDGWKQRTKVVPQGSNYYLQMKKP